MMTIFGPHKQLSLFAELTLVLVNKIPILPAQALSFTISKSIRFNTKTIKLFILISLMSQDFLHLDKFPLYTNFSES